MPKVSLDDLHALAARALARAGANDDMAAATARALVYADARGLASHGVSRIGQYAMHLSNGRADGSARPVFVAERGGAVLIDAGFGLAYPACALAVTEAIRRAHDFGVAFAGCFACFLSLVTATSLVLVPQHARASLYDARSRRCQQRRPRSLPSPGS